MVVGCPCLFAESLMTTFSMWESLCLRYLGVVFHPSGSFCDQNVRFLPKRKYYCGEVSLPICCCFPPFHICLPLLKYIFYLTCSFVLPCRFSSVPEIFRGDFSSKWDHVCPKRKILPRSNYYCAWRGYFANLLLFPVFSFVCFCLYIFLLYLSD